MNMLDGKTRNMIIAVLAALVLFLLVKTVADVYSIKQIDDYASKTISIQGKGEVTGTPDVATFSFTVREQAKDVAAAQKAMSEKANKAIEYLKGQGVEARDIKTENYYTNPVYDYTTNMYAPVSSPLLTGYEVSETVSVKVRKIDKAGDFLTAIAGLKVGEVSSLSFTIDDPDALKAQAKKKAIENARADAEKTAEALGVEIKSVVGFYEENPYEDPYAYDQMKSSSIMNEGSISVSPVLQPGEQKINSTVSVTFEISD